MSYDKIKSLLSRFTQLKEERSSWDTTWRDIRNYMMPYYGRYLDGIIEDQKSRGQRKDQKVINGIGGDAVEILAAGMQGGLTSPSRPWFQLSLPDKELAEFGAVKRWLYEVRQLMLHIFSKSNFYGTLHSTYEELGAFCTSVFVIEEDFKNVIRTRPLTIGEYYLALDERYMPETLFRKFAMTAGQMVSLFGREAVSSMVLSAIDRQRPETRFEVLHCIMKNDEQVLGILKSPEGKSYISYYFECGRNEGRFLRVEGYDTKPFVAPRWKVNGIDTYGFGPGWKAIGDIKMIQKMEEKKLKALDKMVDPPMNAPITMKGRTKTTVSGGVNYLDVAQGQRGFEPVYQVNPDFQNIAYELDRVERRIQRFFFNDLFLSILQTDKTMTATEVVERHEEKLLMLGPVLERLQSELLDPAIDRVFSIMQKFNILPPVPQEIAGMDIKIEYISLLAQAQKLAGLTSLERTAGFITNLAGINPDILDKLDFDQAVDEYAEMVGASPNIIRTDEEVADIRAEKARIAQQQQMQESLPNTIKSAKLLSETKPVEGSLLEELV